MKQVIVIRRDLHMRQGKAVAQGAHAAMMFMIASDFKIETAEMEWIESGMCKVCVRVESESELNSIIDAAVTVGIKVFPVVDAGHTEFSGVPTLTCCAIGPDVDEKIDAITGTLKLL